MYKELTEEEKKELEKFPKYYNNNITTWVGSREYWESLFESETNRKPELHTAFSELHHKIVDMVIQFCEEHGLKDVDEFRVSADGLSGSYGSHTWQCFTDSSMSMFKLIDGENGWKYADRENPFLYEI